jgi:hypothetical protein
VSRVSVAAIAVVIAVRTVGRAVVVAVAVAEAAARRELSDATETGEGGTAETREIRAAERWTSSSRTAHPVARSAIVVAISPTRMRPAGLVPHAEWSAVVIVAVAGTRAFASPAEAAGEVPARRTSPRSERRTRRKVAAAEVARPRSSAVLEASRPRARVVVAAKHRRAAMIVAVVVVVIPIAVVVTGGGSFVVVPRVGAAARRLRRGDRDP